MSTKQSYGVSLLSKQLLIMDSIIEKLGLPKREPNDYDYNIFGFELYNLVRYCTFNGHTNKKEVITLVNAAIDGILKYNDKNGVYEINGKIV